MRALLCATLLLVACAAVHATHVDSGDATLDMTDADVVIVPDASSFEALAATMLAEEVAKRTGVQWNVVTAPVAGRYSIFVRMRTTGVPAYASAAEAFRVSWETDGLHLSGAGPRGVMYAVGHVLRHASYALRRVSLAKSVAVAHSEPQTRVRGHMLSYRAISNTYDSWGTAQMEQYMRELMFFGCNQIEMTRPDGDASVLFPMPQEAMIGKVSAIAQRYALNFSVWYPLHRDVSQPGESEAALRDLTAFLAHVPYLTSLFVPGGDPGNLAPSVLMPFLARVSPVLHGMHPEAQLWVSSQGFNSTWMDDFFARMQEEPEWLDGGYVFGPHTSVDLPTVFKNIPRRFAIRHYPDLCHTTKSELPVNHWDVQYSFTQQREVVNALPYYMAGAFAEWTRLTDGFGAYSDGVNDDVNKAVWSALAWAVDANVTRVLWEYANVYTDIDTDNDMVVSWIEQLEAAWLQHAVPDLAMATRVLTRAKSAMALGASPAAWGSWRAYLLAYRSFYDAYEYRRRQLEEAAHKTAARTILTCRPATRASVVAQAIKVLNTSVVEGDVQLQQLRASVFSTASLLFSSIGMQLSVPLYHAASIGRGASLDTIDVPLNDRRYLMAALPKATTCDEAWGVFARTAVREGSYYDNCGVFGEDPHIVYNEAPNDYTFAHSTLTGFQEPFNVSTVPVWPIAWYSYAQALYDTPLRARYEAGEISAVHTYKLRVTYGTDDTTPLIRCTANGVVVHDWTPKPYPPKPLEFDVPASALVDGQPLTFEWEVPNGRGGSGRGNNIFELWLLCTDC